MALKQFRVLRVKNVSVPKLRFVKGHGFVDTDSWHQSDVRPSVRVGLERA